MDAMIELAQYRPQDILAEAARYRLVEDARPTQPLTLLSKEALWRVIQRVCTFARGALSARSLHALNAASQKSAQSTFTLAH